MHPVPVLTPLLLIWFCLLVFTIFFPFPSLLWFLSSFSFPPYFSTSFSPSLPSFLLLPQTYNSGGSAGGVAALPASAQKRLDDSAARFTNANFQEVPSSHASSGSKDALAVDAGKSASEAKNKKNSGAGHVVGPRGGRKSLAPSGKPLTSAVVTMATSSTSASASTGPFHQGELMVAYLLFSPQPGTKPQHSVYYYSDHQSTAEMHV